MTLEQFAEKFAHETIKSGFGDRLKFLKTEEIIRESPSIVAVKLLGQLIGYQAEMWVKLDIKEGKVMIDPFTLADMPNKHIKISFDPTKI